MDKPFVKLGDGNAFFIIGSCLTAAKKAGWSQERIEEFRTKAASGDYDQLLRTVQEYFDVHLDEEEDDEREAVEAWKKG